MDIRVISIGTLGANPLWGERDPLRTGHATTTLVRTGDAIVLVDPGLPAPALAARLFERSGLAPDAVTHVFLTSFTPEARRGITLFEHARWLISQTERESVGVPLAQSLARLAHSAHGAQDAGESPHEDEKAVLGVLQNDVSLLRRTEPAPDSIAPGVDLFPLPGMSPGSCGLLISEPGSTTLVCGDAVPTIEHLEQGKILKGAHDRERALESFREAVEIADILIPGRDNLAVNHASGPRGPDPRSGRAPRTPTQE